MIYHQDAKCEETAHVIENWPWGFRMRTTKRVWVESDKTGTKQRYVTQTINPKTGRWCKPKKSTYSNGLVIPVTTDEGKLARLDFSSWDGTEAMEAFKERHWEHLNEENRQRITDTLLARKMAEEVFKRAGASWEIRQSEPVRIV